MSGYATNLEETEYNRLTSLHDLYLILAKSIPSNQGLYICVSEFGESIRMRSPRQIKSSIKASSTLNRFPPPETLLRLIDNRLIYAPMRINRFSRTRAHPCANNRVTDINLRRLDSLRGGGKLNSVVRNY